MIQLLALAFAFLAVQSAPAVLAPTGTLRAAFLATNPVQGRIDARSGAMTGPVPDLVRELARREGVPFVLIPVPDAATVIERVRAGQVDIGFLAYETARATLVDFSQPYALMLNAYLVPSASTIQRSSDVDRRGVRVGAVKGQSQQIFVSEHLRAADVVIHPTMPADATVVSLLTRGELQAFAANRQRMQEIARASTAVRVLRDNFMTIGQAFVVAKGETQKVDALNRFVEDVRRSGFVQRSIDAAGLGESVEVAR